MWLLDCQTSFCLWSARKPWEYHVFPHWWKTQFLICQMIPSFQAIETNKEKQNKTWNALLRSDEGRHINPLVHKEDELNQPRTSSWRKTQATWFFSLGQNFKATFPHAASCPLQVLFWGQSSSPPPPLLPPLPSGHRPGVTTKSFSPSWFYPNSCFQPWQHEYLWHNTRTNC